MRPQPRSAASIAATSIFFIRIIASNAHPVAAGSGSIAARVRTSGESAGTRTHLSLHQPHALSWPPLPTVACDRVRSRSIAGGGFERRSQVQCNRHGSRLPGRMIRAAEGAACRPENRTLRRPTRSFKERLNASARSGVNSAAGWRRVPRHRAGDVTPARPDGRVGDGPRILPATSGTARGPLPGRQREHSCSGHTDPIAVPSAVGSAPCSPGSRLHGARPRRGPPNRCRSITAC